jgi:hypothetical protein
MFFFIVTNPLCIPLSHYAGLSSWRESMFLRHLFVDRIRGMHSSNLHVEQTQERLNIKHDNRNC